MLTKKDLITSFHISNMSYFVVLKDDNIDTRGEIFDVFNKYNFMPTYVPERIIDKLIEEEEEYYGKYERII